jgi:hypothetical protein
MFRRESMFWGPIFRQSTTSVSVSSQASMGSISPTCGSHTRTFSSHPQPSRAAWISSAKATAGPPG